MSKLEQLKQDIANHNAWLDNLESKRGTPAWGYYHSQEEYHLRRALLGLNAQLLDEYSRLAQPCVSDYINQHGETA
jgi:hypothetical protein